LLKINPNLSLPYRQKPAKGRARVCQKYVGETDYGAPARHYRLLLYHRFMIVSLVIWRSVPCCFYWSPLLRLFRWSPPSGNPTNIFASPALSPLPAFI